MVLYLCVETYKHKIKINLPSVEITNVDFMFFHVFFSQLRKYGQLSVCWNTTYMDVIMLGVSKMCFNDRMLFFTFLVFRDRNQPISPV